MLSWLPSNPARDVASSVLTRSVEVSVQSIYIWSRQYGLVICNVKSVRPVGKPIWGPDMSSPQLKWMQANHGQPIWGLGTSQWPRWDPSRIADCSVINSAQLNFADFNLLDHASLIGQHRKSWVKIALCECFL